MAINPDPEYWRLGTESISKFVWPGRFQILKQENMPSLILDGAHNEQAWEVLAGMIKKKKFRSLIVVFGISEERDSQKFLEIFKPLAKEFLLTDLEHLKLQSSESILEHSAEKIQRFESQKETFQYLKCQSESTILITGSLYFVGEWVRFLRNDYDELAEFRNLSEDANERSVRI
jgi:dihydrofolate synthase / folylpolyglutamate synthase